MARIELTMNLFTLVDDGDVEKVSGMSWYTGCNGYALHATSSQSHLTLHRVICDAPKGMDVDHVNGDRLDNRRRNLRVVTRSQNALNRADTWPGASKFLGVYRRAIWDKWFVMVPVRGRGQYYCGDYADEEAAARAYDSAVRFYGGKNIKTNFADPVPLDQRQLLIVNGQCDEPISKYRGVSSSGGNKGGKYRAKFGASIYAGRTYKLGHFDTDLEAARAYDAACLLLGLRGRMNFPKSVPGAAAIDVARAAIFPAAGKVAA